MINKGENRMKGLLITFCVLFLLKVLEVINWSWWIITLPLYIIPGTVAIIVFLFVLIATLHSIFD